MAEALYFPPFGGRLDYTFLFFVTAPMLQIITPLSFLAFIPYGGTMYNSILLITG